MSTLPLDLPRKRPRMTPRPQRKPKAPATTVVVSPPPAPPVEVLPARRREDWEDLSDAIARMILRQADETEKYHLRLAWLRARYTPYRDRRAS